jgi:hypothetical protein
LGLQGHDASCPSKLSGIEGEATFIAHRRGKSLGFLTLPSENAPYILTWSGERRGIRRGMGKLKRKLLLGSETFSICRLERNAPIPEWALTGEFLSITRTTEELSVVCPQDQVPPGIQKQEGWKALQVKGPLDFSLTGVLASLTEPLAKEGISVFAISTYDTDYLLVKSEQLKKALRTLRGEGYAINKIRSGGGFETRPYGGRSKRKRL